MRRLLLGTLLLFPTLAAAQDAAVSVKKTDTALEFAVGGKPVTTYQYAGTVQVEKGDAQKPLAKPFFYPLLAPNGAPVTRGYPMERNKPGDTTDHFHQKSVWFCHGDVIAEGLTFKERSSDKRVHGIDFWAENAGHGRIVCVEVGEPKAVSANHVTVPTRNEWRAPDGTKVMDETRVIHFQALPAGYLITLDIDLAASVCPITFGDTKEGSMGVRVNDVIRTANPKGGGTLANSQGKAGEKDVWGYVAEWCDYFGNIEGKTAGLAVFDHPTNPHKAAWHARGYGLMAANPFGRKGSGFPSQKEKADLVKLAKGEHLKLKYGVYAHDGDTAAGKVAEAYQAFAK